MSGFVQASAYAVTVDGNCSRVQAALVKKHISGQIDALGKTDWKLAYSFASPKFRSTVTIAQFTSIITSSYGMLVKNQGYRFDTCRFATGTITQDLIVRGDTQIFYLTYMLSIKGSKLGIESARTTNVETIANA